MNKITRAYVAEADILPLAELDRVECLADERTEEGAVVPAGAKGTVVAVWEMGAAYEIEFAHPFHALLTVGSSRVRKLTDAPV